MIIHYEECGDEFEFWLGGYETAKHLTDAEKIEVFYALEEEHPDGMTPTEVNDVFWYEEDWIARVLGYSDWDELISREEE